MASPTPLRAVILLAILALRQIKATDLRNPFQCGHDSILTSQLPNNLICPRTTDDDTVSQTGQWHPWAFSPECLRSPNFVKYCLYIYSTFQGDRPISIITTPEAVADMAYTLEKSMHILQNGRGGLSDLQSIDKKLTYLIEDLPGKGKGVVARRTIHRGEALMIDSPTMVIALSYLQTVKPEHRRILLQRSVDLLPDLSVVMDLAQSTGGHPVEDVLRTNTFDIKIGDTSHIGLFAELSRINHSCKPNSFTRFSRSTMTNEIVASRKIEAGEEITISYAPLGLTYHERQKLIKKWGFSCDCPICSASFSHNISDRRRIRIAQIWYFLERQEYRDHDDVVKLTNELLGLVKDEELDIRIGDFYERLAKVYLYINDLQNSERFGRLALEYWKKYDGMEQDNVKRNFKFLNDLEERAKAGIA